MDSEFLKELGEALGKTNTPYHLTLAFAVLQIPVVLFVLSTTGSLDLIKRFAQWLWHCFRCTCCFERAGSDADPKLQELHSQYRMQIAKSASAVGLLLAAAFRLYQVVETSRTDYKERIQRDLLLLAWEALLLTVPALIAVGRMSWRWMNAAYFLLMFLLAASTLPGMIPGVNMVHAISMTWLLRCSILPLTDSVKLAFACNLLCHLAIQASSARSMALLHQRTSINARSITQFAEGNVSIDMAISLLSCLICSWLQHTTFSMVEKTLEATTLKNEAKACESLLATFCDSHFFLDAQLRFVKDVPNLASMLFRASNNAGTDFMQCLAGQDDKDRFLEAVNRPDSERAFLAQALHLALRDGYGNCIPVECFHVKTVDAHGQNGHLVGLVEDAQAGAEVPLAPSTSPGVRKSASESTSESGGGLDCREEAFVLFDAVDLNIASVSPDFVDTTGIEFPYAGKFSDIVANQNEQIFAMDFLAQLEAAVAKAEEERGEEIDLESPDRPHFRMKLHVKLRNGRVVKSKWKFYVQQQDEQLRVQGVLIKILDRLLSPAGAARWTSVKKRSGQLAPLPESIGQPRLKSREPDHQHDGHQLRPLHSI